MAGDLKTRSVLLTIQGDYSYQFKGLVTDNSESPWLTIQGAVVDNLYKQLEN